MLRLHYADGFVITADDIGAAVIEYARALAEAQTSEVVKIPIIDSSGRSGKSTLLLGPASQLYSTPTDEGGSELRDEQLVAELSRRTQSLRSVAVVPDDLD